MAILEMVLVGICYFMVDGVVAVITGSIKGKKAAHRFHTGACELGLEEDMPGYGEHFSRYYSQNRVAVRVSNATGTLLLLLSLLVGVVQVLVLIYGGNDAPWNILPIMFAILAANMAIHLVVSSVCRVATGLIPGESRIMRKAAGLE